MSFKLFLGGVAPSTSTEGIQDHFSKYGTITDAIVMYKDGKHRGFGFVTFESEDAMHAALAEEQVIDGRTIDVKQAVREGSAPAPSGKGSFGGSSGGKGGKGGKGGTISMRVDKVFLGGLAPTTFEDTVKDYFSQYGNIIDCIVMKDKESQRSKGFGFVQYDNCDSVEAVMTDYANHTIEGKWVEVKKAIPQQDKGAGRGGGGGGGGGYGGGRSDSYGGGGGGASYPPPAGYGGGAYGGYAAPPPSYGYPPAPAYGGAYAGGYGGAYSGSYSAYPPPSSSPGYGASKGAGKDRGAYRPY